MKRMTRTRHGGRVLVQMNGLGLGGTEINAVQFAAAVREHGYDSILVGPADTLPAGPSIRDVASEYGIEVTPFERPTSAVRAARLLDGLATEAGADLVHVYGQGTIRGAYLGPCRLARRPLVQTAYEMAIDPYTLDAPELIVGTRYLLEECEARVGETTLISPPVDLDRDTADAADAQRFRADWRIAADQTAVVWVGRLDPEMKAPAVRTLIDAVASMRDERVRLVIVGGGRSEAELRHRGEQANSRLGRDAIVFTGALGDPRPAYAAADISVGMGSSAARGLAFGVPLVVIGENGWSQTFTPGTAAGLFRNSFWSAEAPPDAAADLARHLTALVADPAHAGALGTFGREFAEREFGLTAMGARLAAVYERARTSYTGRMWLHDLHRERRAATHLVRRRLGFPTRGREDGEYRYPI